MRIGGQRAPHEDKLTDTMCAQCVASARRAADMRTFTHESESLLQSCCSVKLSMDSMPRMPNLVLLSICLTVSDSVTVPHCHCNKIHSKYNTVTSDTHKLQFIIANTVTHCHTDGLDRVWYGRVTTACTTRLQRTNAPSPTLCAALEQYISLFSRDHEQEGASETQP